MSKLLAGLLLLILLIIVGAALLYVYQTPQSSAAVMPTVRLPGTEKFGRGMAVTFQGVSYATWPVERNDTGTQVFRVASIYSEGKPVNASGILRYVFTIEVCVGAAQIVQSVNAATSTASEATRAATQAMNGFGTVARTLGQTNVANQLDDLRGSLERGTLTWTTVTSVFNNVTDPAGKLVSSPNEITCQSFLNSLVTNLIIRQATSESIEIYLLLRAAQQLGIPVSDLIAHIPSGVLSFEALSLSYGRFEANQSVTNLQALGVAAA